jgi:transposase
MELSDDIFVLKNLVVSLLKKVEELQAENAQLRAENTELRHRLEQNSRNSSQPPSKDMYKPNPKPAFSKTDKGQKGGQVGHQGKTLLQVTTPDAVVVISSPTICSCGCDISHVSEHLQQSRQVFDLPKVSLHVTEYHQYSRRCPSCKQRLVNDFPLEVGKPVQYGKGVMAFCSLLSTGFHLSCQQIGQLFSDLYGQSLNEGTVIAANQRSYEALASTETLIKEQILQSQVVHFDETGLACEGNTHWLHTASTAFFTYLFVHQKRGKKAIGSDQSLLKRFTNWAIHDCWASYFGFTEAKHALCNAHILRELQALIDQNSQWATKMHALLMKIYLLTDKGKTSLTDISSYLQEYQQICKEADLEEPPPIKATSQNSNRGRPKSSKGRNLLLRLVVHQDSVLAFAKYDHIPFTNNQAERDIRPVKGKIKQAGSFRSTAGADAFARVQSFISTARKHNISVFKELYNTLNGANFITTAYAAK